MELHFHVTGARFIFLTFQSMSGTIAGCLLADGVAAHASKRRRKQQWVGKKKINNLGGSR
jgi:hypothetical protein